MGITKLMNIKAQTNNAASHLHNSVEYILDEKHECMKTENGQWVYSNVGTTSKDVVDQFLKTKAMYNKESGRQGYHFVISFKEGEATAQTCYNIAQEFCEKFLGDKYEYIMAVHTDKPHMHAHIIFNSVSLETGEKYHYKKGDWKKDIQTITDELSEKYGLDPLVYDEDRIGLSYAEFAKNKDLKISLRDIVRADMDYAIHKANSYDEFLGSLGQMGYKTHRFGQFKDGQNYFSVSLDGKSHVRTRSLGTGYSVEDIKRRIQYKDNRFKNYEDLSKKMENHAGAYVKPIKMSTYRKTKPFRRLYQAVNYYKLPNPYAVPQFKVRKDMRQLNKIIAQCAYLSKNNISTNEDIHRHLRNVEDAIAVAKAERNTFYSIQRIEKELPGQQKDVLQQCRQMLKEIENSDVDLWETYEEQYEMLAAQLPPEIVENEMRLHGATLKLKQLRREKLMLEKINEAQELNKNIVPDFGTKPKM